jgi:hypothetical protein
MLKRIVFCVLLLFSLGFAKEAGIEPGKAVLKLRQGASPEHLETELSRLRILSIAPRYQAFKDKKGLLRDIYELSFAPAISPYSIANALREHPEVLYAEPIYLDETLESPDDTHYSEALNFAAMQAEAAWDLQKCEDNPVVIAIVDTGVAWKHPDLAQNIWNNLGEDANNNGYTIYHNGTAWVMDPGDMNGIDDDGNGKVDDLIGWNFIVNIAGDENNEPNDPGSHGTRVAGLAGAVTNNGIGVASLSWNPILMPISCARTGATSTIFRGYDAILYAAENGAQVINCSWGSTGFSQASKDLIDYVVDLGAVVVAAAGNSNNATPIYPAAYPGVIAVASLNNDGAKWSGSSFGAFVDFGVPNQNFYTTTPAAGYFSGSGTTSYASPIGSAMAALVLAQNPGFSPQQVRNQILATCTNIDAQNPSYIDKLGGGLINAFLALSTENPTQTPMLKLGLFSAGTPKDQSAELSLDPGDVVSLNVVMRNYTDFSGNANFTLSSSNPNITILQANHSSAVPADEFFALQDAFQIQINPGAASQYVSLQMSVTADLPIHSATSYTLQFLINNGGIYVWEPVAGGRDLSGTFIRNTLQAEGRAVVHGTVFPGSLNSFDAVFLSFGSLGSNNRRLNELYMYQAIRDYLLSGGLIYIEGADVIGWDLEYYLGDADGGLGAHTVLWQLLGLASASDGATNPISLLQAELPFSEILFTASNQMNVDYIDLYVPATSDGFSAFTEDGYGTVGVAGKGVYGQRSVVLSYALAELVDGEYPNTRAYLLNEIMNWFIKSPVLQISATETGLRLDWEDVSLARSYNVYFAEDPYADFVLLEGDLQQNYYEVSTPGARGFYKVQAMP